MRLVVGAQGQLRQADVETLNVELFPIEGESIPSRLDRNSISNKDDFAPFKKLICHSPNR